MLMLGSLKTLNPVIHLHHMNDWLTSKFTHLELNKVSYFHHLLRSLGYAGKSLMCSLVFLIHGVYPDVMCHTGSNMVYTLNRDIISNKDPKRNN